MFQEIEFLQNPEGGSLAVETNWMHIFNGKRRNRFLAARLVAASTLLLSGGGALTAHGFDQAAEVEDSESAGPADPASASIDEFSGPGDGNSRENVTKHASENLAPNQVFRSTSFTVQTTADTPDSSAGNGNCADSNGLCSLRAAIQEANALSGDDSITVPAGSYFVTTPLFISSNILLAGAGSDLTILDGSDQSSVVIVTSGSTNSHLRDMTIQHGYFDAGASNLRQGAVTVETAATLDLTDTVVRDSTSVATGGGFAGGAGITNRGTVVLRRVVVSNNEASYGGGIYHAFGQTTILDSRIVENRAVGTVSAPLSSSGGGLAGGGPLLIERSLFSNNSAARGSAIIQSPADDARIINSTFSGNVTINGGAGHVIVNFAGSGDSSLLLEHCTIAENPLTANSAVATDSLGSLQATTRIKNTIIENSGISQCSVSGTNASTISHDYNIISDASCFPATNHDLVNTSAMLSPLADHGGFTQTYALQAGSAALNSIPPASCTTVAGAAVSDDQRGAARPAQGACERGAYEQAVCGDGLSGGPEECDDGNAISGDCCSASCVLESNSTVCRPAAGVCDIAESCTGSSATCPSNQFATGVCRGAAGVCDLVESCSGTSAACPANGFLPENLTCRLAAGVCDATENCTGTSASCPADAFVLSSVTCRVATGVCDVSETCTGTHSDCPSDSFRSASLECRAAAGICDIAETCNGSTAACPGDALAATSVTCRAAAGICDAAENCSGNAAACPANTFLSPSSTCRAAAGVCDVSEACSGSSASCPADVLEAATTVCRAAASDCDAAETCSGSMPACRADGFRTAGSPCGDPGELVCDHADTCDGSGACLSNFADDGTLCDDTDTCTSDQCIDGACESEQINGCPIVPGDAAIGNEFGRSVALTRDYLVVGAPASLNEGSGRVHVFLVTEDGYAPQTQSEPIDVPFHDDQLTGDLDFGAAVDADRDTIVVGAPFDVVPVGDTQSSGSATVFVRSGGTWIRQVKLLDQTGACSQFGSDVGIDGDTIVVGAPGGDCALIFERGGSQWSMTAQLEMASGATRFGASVDVSGLSVLVGAPGNELETGCSASGTVYAFRRAESGWEEDGQIDQPEEAGGGACFAAAVGVDLTTAVAGAPFDGTAGTDAGAAYVFDRIDGQWQATDQLLAFPDPQAVQGFGASLAISADVIIVGAPAVAAYAFQRRPSEAATARSTLGSYFGVRSYTPPAASPPGESDFATAVSISSDRAVVGAPAERPDGLPNAGAVYPTDATPEPTSTCGDFVVNQTEQCDDGDTDWSQGEFCNAACNGLACGDTNDDGAVMASDALYALKAAVGARSCAPQVCDTDDSGSISANDALRILRKAVGTNVGLTCPQPPAAAEVVRHRLAGGA